MSAWGREIKDCAKFTICALLPFVPRVASARMSPQRSSPFPAARARRTEVSAAANSWALLRGGETGHWRWMPRSWNRQFTGRVQSCSSMSRPQDLLCMLCDKIARQRGPKRSTSAGAVQKKTVFTHRGLQRKSEAAVKRFAEPLTPPTRVLSERLRRVSAGFQTQRFLQNSSTKTVRLRFRGCAALRACFVWKFRHQNRLLIVCV